MNHERQVKITNWTQELVLIGLLTLFTFSIIEPGFLFQLDNEMERCEEVVENDMGEGEDIDDSDGFLKVFPNDGRFASWSRNFKSFTNPFAGFLIMSNTPYEVPHPPPEKTS